MFKKKHLIWLLLGLMMIISLAACGKGNTTPSKTDSQTEGNDSSGGKTNDSQNTESAKLTGKLNIINLNDRDSSILKGIVIYGNSIGSNEDINGKESSLTDVRCIFVLNEWVEFYPDIDTTYSLRAWILKHRSDQDYYNNCTFSDSMPNFVQYCDLQYPEDADDPSTWYWGNFYLNSEDSNAGYYDFVFTYKGKAIATLFTRFYNEKELENKSGTELEALMHQ